MGTILIKNIYAIATMNQNKDVLKGYDIFIKENKIAKIGTNLNERAEKIIDGSNLVAIPGMINTHHHLYQTLFRNVPLVQNSKLFDWLINLYETWSEIDEEAVYYGALVGLGELLLTGCTCSTDHHYVFPENASKHLIDVEIKAAQELGIRFYPTRGSMTLSKKDGGLPPDKVVQNEDEIMNDYKRLIEKFHDPEPFSMTRINLAPCSPFSVKAETMIKTAEFARKYEKVLLHTHVAETLDEEKFCLEKFNKRPIDYMEELGWLGDDVWFAHCVYLNDEEIKKMAKTKTGIAHCPSSNMRLGSGIAPIPKLLKYKAKVGLAVDGSASNDTSDMLGELRQCLLSNRVKWGVDSITAIDTLYMATKGGAQIFNSPELGSIEKNNAADIALFNIQKIWYAGALHDPIAALIFSGASHIAEYTIVNGKIVVENGNLVNINTDSVVLKANNIAKDLILKTQKNTNLKFL